MAEHRDHTVVEHVTPGEIIGERWRIEKRVGQGAMGSVFRARDIEENHVVAIKLLSPEHVGKAKVLARFEREAELLTTLRHPNLVQFFGHGRRGALPYIAMEYLEGMTLADAVQKKGGTLTVSETVAVIKQVASGLAFLHHHGLVHRDVKPQNIFVTNSGRIAILDLGVVRDQHNPGLTKPGAMVGTPYYMSPEQILGLDDIDRRTDVYALAAMTFELLVGRPPYLGSNNFEVLYAHRNTPAPDASTLLKSIPKQVGQVLTRGLAKKRDERPDTASEFAYDLEAIAGAKKLDLAKVFAFLDKRAATREVTRITKKPQRSHSADDVPLADNEDVLSVANAVPQKPDKPAAQGSTPKRQPAERRTDPERTFVGVIPEAPPEKTFIGAPPTAPPERKAGVLGSLRVVVNAQGKPVPANVFVNGHHRGTAPKLFQVAVGKVSVRIELSGFRSVEKTIAVNVGATSTLKIELSRG